MVEQNTQNQDYQGLILPGGTEGLFGLQSPKPLSIRDLARILELSHTTVSKALRNDPKISARTRERVQEAAREHGYVPDPETVKYMTHIRKRNRSVRRGAIAILTCLDGIGSLRRNKYYDHFIQNVKERSNRNGYDVDVFHLGAPGIDAKAVNKILQARNIRGIIIGPSENDKHLEGLDFDYFTVSLCAVPYETKQQNRVEPDVFHNTELALKTVYEKGYRRPGLVLRGGYMKLMLNRSLGAYSLFSNHNELDKVISPHVDPGYDNEKLMSWYEENKPDVIVSNCMSELEGFVSAGFKVPDDLGYFCMNLSRGVSLEAQLRKYWPTDTIPSVSGIDMNSEQLDQAVVDLLMTSLFHNEFGPTQDPRVIAIQGTVVEGQTIKGE